MEKSEFTFAAVPIIKQKLEPVNLAHQVCFGNLSNTDPSLNAMFNPFTRSSLAQMQV